MILIIDPSYNNNGYCVANPKKTKNAKEMVLESGVIKLKGDLMNRAYHLQEYLEEKIFNEYDIDTVVLEVPDKLVYDRMRGIKTIEPFLKLGMSIGWVTAIVDRHRMVNNKRIEFCQVSPAEWNPSKRKKEDTQLTLKYLGIDITDHNEADAVYIAWWYCSGRWMDKLRQNINFKARG